MASSREYELLFQLNAELGGSYNSAFGSAQKSLVTMQKEIDALNKLQADISSYQKQQSAVETSEKKLELLKQQYDNIKKEMSETGASSSDLQNKLLAKQLQIDKTSAAIDTQNAKLGQMGNALRSAGVNTDDLTRESSKLGTQIDALKEKQEEAADEAQSFGEKTSQAFGAMEQAIAAAGIEKTMHEIYEVYMDCTDASMEYENTMTDVSKTVELSDDEFAAMSKNIKELSTEIPETNDELGSIVETAGQLSIAKGSLIDFTEIMAKLGMATDMTSEDAATMLAQFTSITGMDTSYYSNLGSTIASLSDHYATTGNNIVSMGQAIAASASIAKMSEPDIMGISAAVTSMGISGQSGGMQINKLIADINNAVSSGEGLEAWARASGMDANTFAKAWKDNAAGALDTLIQGLNDTYKSGGDLNGVLNGLGITDARMQKVIMSLAASGDRLTNTLKTANQAWKENTALNEEAQKKYSTTQSQLTLLQNAYKNQQIAIGDDLNPELKELYKLGIQILEGTTEFTEQNPALVKAVTAFVAVLGLVIAALGAYTIAAKIATAFSTAFATATGVALGPILAVVAGVAALVSIFVGLSAAYNEQTDKSWELTAVSREQYNKLQDLNKEYENAVKIYGETSYEAQQLQWQIKALNEEYENGKQTTEEYDAAHKEVIDSYKEMVSSHQDAEKKINTEENSVLALTSKLRELAATTQSAANNQQAILAIINALNSAVPNLALSYDDVIKNSGGVAEYVQNVAKAQAAQNMLKDEWSEYVDRIGKQATLQADKDAAEKQAKTEQKEYDTAKKAYDEKLAQAKVLGVSEATAITMAADEAKAYAEAKAQLDDYNKSLAETSNAYNENEAAITGLEGKFKNFYDEQEKAPDSISKVNDSVTEITNKMSKLGDEYTKAYDAALDSVQGQYDIWDKAAKIIPKNIDTINDRLAGQDKYWQRYNQNLENLSSRAGKIEGLSNVIASFADGSKDSVDMIAGMSKASDSDLKTMVKNWQALQKEQGKTSDNLADIKTDFTTTMGELKQELITSISEMNLSNDAATAGEKTIQGFISAAKDKDLLEQVKDAYENIANVAISAFEKKLTSSGIPNQGYSGSTSTPTSGFASGTLNAAPGWAWVGELGPELMAMRGGETIIPSDMSMGAVTEALRLSALPAKEQANALYGARSGSGIIIAPSYTITGTDNPEKIQTMLRERDTELRGLILDVMTEAGIDAKRSEYV